MSICRSLPASAYNFLTLLRSSMPVKGLRRNDAATCTTAGILIFFQCPMTTAGKPKKEMLSPEHGTQKSLRQFYPSQTHYTKGTIFSKNEIRKFHCRWLYSKPHDLIHPVYNRDPFYLPVQFL